MSIENQNFEILHKSVDGRALQLKVQVHADVVKKIYKDVHKMLVKHVRIPGFRPGKAPMSVLSGFVGKENFEEEVRRRLLPDYYYKAVESSGYRPMGGVTYEGIELSSHDPFVFTAQVEVAPDATLGDYKALTIERPALDDLGEEDVEKELKALAYRYAERKDTEDGHVIGDDDQVLCSVGVKVEGEEIKTLRQSGISIVIGREQYLEGFDEALRGHVKGDTFDVELPLKGPAAPKYLEGKQASLSVSVKVVKQLKLPELNDDLAKDLGLRSVSALRDKVREEILEEARKRAKQTQMEDLRKAILAITEISLPDGLVEHQVDHRLEEMEERLKSEDITLERFCEERGQSEEEFRAEIRKEEEEGLKFQFALDAIADKEQIEVSDDDVAQLIVYRAQRLGVHPERYVEILDEEGRRVLMRYEIAREKALDFLRRILLEDGAKKGAEEPMAESEAEA